MTTSVALMWLLTRRNRPMTLQLVAAYQRHFCTIDMTVTVNSVQRLGAYDVMTLAKKQI